ncbi:MAG: hypothetical protein M3198_13390, partial [Actinomycetota bacterium]|nr:hypothetical protein [Actinomycetota bacterium]
MGLLSYLGAATDLRRGQDGAPAARARTNDLDDVGGDGASLWLERSWALAAFGRGDREGIFSSSVQRCGRWAGPGSRVPVIPSPRRGGMELLRPQPGGLNQA